ncbi:uncharacterized protein LOC106134385 [Amyelois transitella]|uniref:uncharacterized protein LOC106134385 n=1 Tax=Amyelois transitella TaxID=680683 RepID=UPI002990155C|nr:uncharacterized protein LOC106134385 [Amyelois transitella]
MSDKGFGDPVGRSVLKNPLLSTAVTGLSIEDLTHNAVLLPVVPSQDLITGRDQSTGPQNRSLGNTEPNVTNIVSADVNSNTVPSNRTVNPSTTPNLPGTKQDDSHSKIKYPPTTMSKATSKSEDDFDVNEYFARLQGTKYVSAPINSLLKEDNNANLETTDENLEEINLNEPDKIQLEVQQSLTADIAQNFSQLPTVLPQVASAVFSSFSNMLSMKREPTYEELKSSPGYQVPSQRQEINVPLMGVDEPVKDVAPPPKEPPIGGTSNYRITTKKKAYAQIPGLSSKDNTQINALPPSHTIPSYMTPNPNITDIRSQPGVGDDKFRTEDAMFDQSKHKDVDAFSPVSDTTYSLEQSVQPTQPIYYPQRVESAFESNAHQAFSNIRPNYDPLKIDSAEQKVFDIYNAPAPITQPNTAIIPPPPMFSNLPRKDNQTGIGKSILPPSVARRISANQPVIKQQTSQIPIDTGNIFVPAIDNTQENILGRTPSIDQCQQRKFEQAIHQPPSFSTGKFQSGGEIQENMSTFLSSSNQSISTILPPSSTKLASEKDREIGFQTTNVPPATASTPNVSNEASFPVNLPPPSTKLAAPPSISASNIFRITSQPTTLPPPPTNIFTPIITTEDSQSASLFTSASVTSNAFLKPETKMSYDKLESKIPPVNIFQSTPNSINNAPPTLTTQPSLAPISTNVVPVLTNKPPIEINKKAMESQFPSPPTFFSQNTTHMQSNAVFAPQQNDNPLLAPASEPPKPIPEPPKLSGNLNYRLTKKRPQYYSGPIEGVGSISNNVKPVLPTANPGNFHGALFTPTQIQDQELVVPNIEQSNLPQTYPSFDISNPMVQPFEASYSTAFDLSRQTTDSYEPPKEETKGFGIIGSLKSKLGSLDINKIQNSVTTFFDPSYNNSKQENDSDKFINKSYEHQFNPSVYGQKDNLGICIDPSPHIYPQYSDQINYQNQQYNYGENKQYYNNQEYYYQNQSQMYPSCTDFTQLHAQNTHETSVFANTGNVVETGNIYHESTETNAFGESRNIVDAQVFTETYLEDMEERHYILSANSSGQALIQSVNRGETDLHAKEHFDISPSIPDLIPKVGEIDLHSNVVTSEGDIKEDKLIREKGFTDLHRNEVPLTESQVNDDTLEQSTCIPLSLINTFSSSRSSEKKDLTAMKETIAILKSAPNKIIETDSNNSVNRQESESVKLENAFANYTFDTDSNDKDFFNSPKEQDLKKDPSIEKKSSNVSVPLFDLSSMIAGKLEDSQREYSQNDSNVFDREASVSFSENDLENKPLLEDSQEEDSISDFNICETCREVNRPEIEDEKEDLTAQLIENIIAPIQLSNPVEVPLTEINTPVDDGIIFDSDQCAEISHIIEDTIETIQGQSATKLLDNDSAEQNTRSYGWNVDESSTTPKDVLDHDYSFQMNTNAIGFFGDNSMFFENIPCNASDEIKAEFKNSQDETSSPIIPPRQLSIPTASSVPVPDDDDSKSDETGLDVHSIEQDAKNDFPLYEEFVIDPSETDDDKIEIKERERSSDDPIPDVDTFTNRIERFKKMEESSENIDEMFGVQKKIEIITSTSPAITIASYFDTGNYAAETHYKNSLSSSSPFSQINISSPSKQTRVPPGFENEHPRRLSGSLDSFGHKNEPYIPETATQTAITTTTSYSIAPTTTVQDTIAKITDPATLFSKLDLNDQPQESSEKTLSPFATIFGVNKEPSTGPTDSKHLEETTSQTVSYFGLHPIKLEGGDAASVFADKPPAADTLPDPLSFFSSKEEPKEDTDNGFNRLASYFTSPTKTDPAKSFFELSQSQNHYRHVSNQDGERIFNLNQTRNNIPTSNLINDLTSCENIINRDQIVRTVNYFTVEYDSNININKIKITVPNYCKERLDTIVHNDLGDGGVEENCNDDAIDVVKSCNNCCNITNDDKLYREVMDNSNNDKGSADMNQPERRESGSDKRKVSVTLGNNEEASEGVAMLKENRAAQDYIPVRHHWFYRVDLESKSTWRGFSLTDSKALEEAFHSPTLNENTLVATDGGRYDVNIIGRLRLAVYWSDKPSNVMRCSWFYKGNTDARYVPYSEHIAEKLEEEYRHGVTTGEWHRRLVLPNNELVVMHGPSVMVHLLQTSADGFNSAAQSAMRPRVVRRGWDESEIEDTEPSNIDHLLLLCHGVGSACDMRFRSVEEVVDDFRATSLQLLQSHYRNSYDNGVVNRVEVLPISWHSSLHSGETGVDRRLAEITLESIPRLRNFTNDTVLDVLFYTSPLYCQTIVNTVCAELNRIYRLFKSRNPNYRGTVSLGGHSLGSVILYDLLCHQNNSGRSPAKSMVGGGTGADISPAVRYPALEFSPAALYALGSPIAMFECIRGVDSLGDKFCLPTCNHFFNIFHPYDPIAYRIEPLINRQLKDVKPSLIPHHKGRKRMHLELKDTMARVGADLKQKLIESLKATWTSVWKTTPPIDGQLEKVVEEEMEKDQECKEETTQEEVTPELLGRLNSGRRVDYVLQEAPFEMINEYLFAMSSHVCYWESEDTMLLILREIYDSLGVPPDCSVPQNSMSVQRSRSALKDDASTEESATEPSTSRGST